MHVSALVGWKHNSRLVYDPLYPKMYQSVLKECQWSEFCRVAKEAICKNGSEPLSNIVVTCIFVDSEHSWEKVSFRSRSGFLTQVKTAIVQRFSKKQSTTETSVFWAEFVAMKLKIDALRDLRYKLRMVAIPVSSPTNIYGDNMSVVRNTSRPESVLRKKAIQFTIMQSMSRLQWESP